MNYYDALVHHNQRLEEFERQQENTRHLRDSQRKQEETRREAPKRPSAFLRFMGDMKAAVTSLNLLAPRRVMHAGHAAAIKDVTC